MTTASDDAVRARVDGRERLARRIVWQLEIPGYWRFRCVAVPDEPRAEPSFVLEVHDGKKWIEAKMLAKNAEAQKILRSLTTAETVERSILARGYAARRAAGGRP